MLLLYTKLCKQYSTFQFCLWAKNTHFTMNVLCQLVSFLRFTIILPTENTCTSIYKWGIYLFIYFFILSMFVIGTDRQAHEPCKNNWKTCNFLLLLPLSETLSFDAYIECLPFKWANRNGMTWCSVSFDRSAIIKYAQTRSGRCTSGV